jgi:hypothetical protein
MANISSTKAAHIELEATSVGGLFLIYRPLEFFKNFRREALCTAHPKRPSNVKSVARSPTYATGPFSLKFAHVSSKNSTKR